MNDTFLSALLPPLRILILGYGNVTRALLPLLAARSEWIGRELGLRPVISGLGSRSQGLYIHAGGIGATQFARESDPLRWFKQSGTRVENASQFIESGKAAGASLFIELTTLNPINGQPALSHIRKALELGMDVITANKGPVAHAQQELQQLARQRQREFRFESSVMDGLPLINLAEFTLPAVGIRSFRALLNSTSNLVLNLIEQGYSQDDAIRRAQEIGVAEADPWYDLDGWDAVMKTTILANTLLDGELAPSMIEREGIRHLTPDDICSAALAGSPYRLVSEVHRKYGIVTAEVHPRRIGADDILRVAQGLSGIISLDTEAMGTITLIEHTPTTLQTAYGVLSDLITIQRHRGNI